MLRSAVWFITMQCNNWCPYCWERQRQKRGEFTPEPFKDYLEWVRGWNRLRPSILDISGGEPFLQPNFMELVEGLHEDIKVAITTNAKCDLTQFAQRISPEKVVSMTLSFHPTSDMNSDIFLGKCLMLKHRGFRITVNFVTYPEQMWLTAGYRGMFEKQGITFHVDPYAQTEYVPFKFTEKEKKFLSFFVGEDRKNALTDEVKPVMCSAGQDHLTVFPDGEAYRCINDKIQGLDSLGNILESNFKLNINSTYCKDYNKCAGCNRDKVVVTESTVGTENKKGKAKCLVTAG